MPTGYTAELNRGEQSFEDYVWGVARGFGALVMMRDEPQGAPIPDEFRPSDYHEKKLKAAQEALAALDRLTLVEASKRALAEREAEVARRNKYREERAEIRARYEAMLEQARAWVPPTADHVGLKETMVEQLERSIEFDCSDIYPDDPPVLLAQDWLDNERQGLLRDVEYHAAEDAKEIERARMRTAWVRALRESLEAVPA